MMELNHRPATALERSVPVVSALASHTQIPRSLTLDSTPRGFSMSSTASSSACRPVAIGGALTLAVLCSRGKRSTSAAATSLAHCTSSKSQRRAVAACTGSLEKLGETCINSWIRDLEADPEQDRHTPNRTSREVRSGHYVNVDPTPLPDPYLVAYSSDMISELGLSEEDAKSESFARLFSGDIKDFPGFCGWATPYALSIYGHEMYSNCPFGNGNGYGDGRALSIGEVVGPKEEPWELQLKGAGRTPFCRGGDGRAVLRSSVREFLTSEAMHHLGVPTTRAVSLVASSSATTMRPWYSPPEPGSDRNIPDSYDLDAMLRRLLKDQRGMDFDGLSDEVKDGLRDQLRAQLSPGGGRDPDIMIKEPLAITCRAARSFLRVGHMELFARRARGGLLGGDAARLRELELLVQHALDREYPDVLPGETLPRRALGMLEEVGRRLAALAANWIRVGYVQGNFNSDNCLVGGRTMDYGPFGFIETYEPMWNMWVGGGDKYGFLNQPNAAFKNFSSFASALAPVLEAEDLKAEAAQVLKDFTQNAKKEMTKVWREKLGLAEGTEEKAEELFQGVEPIMRATGADWTIFWRTLADVAEGCGVEASDSELLAPLGRAFQVPLEGELQSRLAAWLRDWLKEVTASGHSAKDAASSMRRASPKYVPREWMLVRAYTAAEKGDMTVLHQLQTVFQDPYSEQPELEEEYFRSAPPEVRSRGGVAWMT